MLFTNTGTDAHIHLSFCQWAKDNNMVLVYGYLKSKHDIRESFGDYSKPCYLTVTAVPALNGCQECIQVAAVSSARNQFLLPILCSNDEFCDPRFYRTTTKKKWPLPGIRVLDCLV